MSEESYGKIYWMILRFIVFFVMNAFVISCSFMLFFHNLDFSEAQIRQSAPVTFFNVILLSLIFLLIDSIRKKYMIERPVRNIIAGLNQIMKGNLDAKIKSLSTIENTNELNTIIDQINKMTEELASVETLRTDFISNVSHELKTPLAIIQNYSTMLQDPQLPEDKRMEYAKAIHHTSHRLADLITNILKLNKLDNQQIYPETHVYNLTEQLCECILQFESEWERKQLEIETDLDEDVMINADGELLSLVWNNLISNAIKFTDEYGKIMIHLDIEDDMVIVTIKDTGCGMSNETGKHIFEKFYQGDTSHAVQGNGLGLALVKRVIDIMNGDIIVQSEVGKGSQFTIQLKGLMHETE